MPLSHHKSVACAVSSFTVAIKNPFKSHTYLNQIINTYQRNSKNIRQTFVCQQITEVEQTDSRVVTNGKIRLLYETVIDDKNARERVNTENTRRIIMHYGYLSFIYSYNNEISP